MKEAFDAPTPPHQLICLWHLMKEEPQAGHIPSHQQGRGHKEQDGCERHRRAQPACQGKGILLALNSPLSEREQSSTRELQILINKKMQAVVFVNGSSRKSPLQENSLI